MEQMKHVQPWEGYADGIKSVLNAQLPSTPAEHFILSAFEGGV